MKRFVRDGTYCTMLLKWESLPWLGPNFVVHSQQGLIVIVVQTGLRVNENVLRDKMVSIANRGQWVVPLVLRNVVDWACDLVQCVQLRFIGGLNDRLLSCSLIKSRCTPRLIKWAASFLRQSLSFDGWYGDSLNSWLQCIIYFIHEDWIFLE